MKYLKTIIIITGFLPYLYVISLLSLYFHTGYILGYLPITSLNDPKNLSISHFYYPLVLFFGNIWFYSIVPLMILISTYIFIFKKDIYGKILLFIFIGHFVAFILFFTKVLEWFAD